MVLRSSILFLADQQRLRHLASHQPLARKLALRFVAGETLDQAVSVVRLLNKRHIHVTLDHLGENVGTQAEANRAAEEYLEVLERLTAEAVDSNISVKLTHLGLDLGDHVCEMNLRRIVVRAAELGTFVRVDMEGSAYTERTLDLVRALHTEVGNSVGPVIQAYLYRSAGDIEDAIRRQMRVRLCKGAYDEPPALAYARSREVVANFKRLAEPLLLRGNYPAIASHDERIIKWVRDFSQKRFIGPERFEFQLLHGVRRDLHESLAQAGYNVRVYVPYGTQWYPYLMRRLAERPANLFFILSNLFRG